MQSNVVAFAKVQNTDKTEENDVKRHFPRTQKNLSRVERRTFQTIGWLAYKVENFSNERVGNADRRILELEIQLDQGQIDKKREQLKELKASETGPARGKGGRFIKRSGSNGNKTDDKVVAA